MATSPKSCAMYSGLIAVIPQRLAKLRARLILPQQFQRLAWQQSVDFSKHLLMRNQLGLARIELSHASADFLIPCLGNGFGRIVRRTFEADDQSVDEFTAFLERKQQGLRFDIFQYGGHVALRIRLLVGMLAP